jgi:hypothetical protein
MVKLVTIVQQIMTALRLSKNEKVRSPPSVTIPEMTDTGSDIIESDKPGFEL